MRAIFAHGQEQSREPLVSVPSMHGRRQVVFQEEVDMVNDRSSDHLERALHDSQARYDDGMRRLAQYAHDHANQMSANTEQRLEGRLHEALLASHAHVEATTRTQTDQQLLALETRLQQALKENHESIQADARAAIHERASSMENQIHEGMTKTESSVREHALEHALECEARLQVALQRSQEQFETAASVHAELQAAQIEERMQDKLRVAQAISHAESQQHSLECEERLRGVLENVQVDLEARLTVHAEVHAEGVEERLQQKLDGMLEASQAEVRKCIDTRLAETSMDLRMVMRETGRGMAARIDACEASVEARMQDLLRESQNSTNISVAQVESVVREVKRQTKADRRGAESRIAKVGSEMERLRIDDRTHLELRMTALIDSIDKKIQQGLLNAQKNVLAAEKTPSDGETNQQVNAADSSSTSVPDVTTSDEPADAMAFDSDSDAANSERVQWSASWTRYGDKDEILTVLQQISKKEGSVLGEEDTRIRSPTAALFGKGINVWGAEDCHRGQDIAIVATSVLGEKTTGGY
ncbi:hypothetical protein BBJ28_00015819 [Nothophytophthora sp. Chile5]|nr:hypothetical protein BBJ28_00015819 [Nothophytophthora sp. Chile5]